MFVASKIALAMALLWMGSAVMLGGGPSYAHVGAAGGGLTWNAELELDKRIGAADVFARVRQYDYGLPRFREGESGPNGAAIYAGVRVRIGD